MNKYERLFTWVTMAVLILFAIGTCQNYDTHSDTAKDEKISQQQHIIDSLTNVISVSKTKIDTIEKVREVVKTVYRDRIKHVRSLDSSEHNELFDSLYSGRKDSANVKFFENEQCQEELVLCDSASQIKSDIITAHEVKDIAQDSISNTYKEDAAAQKKGRDSAEKKARVWRNIGIVAIVVDVVVVLTVIAIR